MKAYLRLIVNGQEENILEVDLLNREWTTLKVDVNKSGSAEIFLLASDREPQAQPVHVPGTLQSVEVRITQ